MTFQKKIPGKYKRLNFPKGFLWGTATSSHQVEGNNIHSDWCDWEKNMKDMEKTGVACDHYNLFREDISLIKNLLHNNAYRFSVEWAKIEPEEGKFDKEVIKHYREVLTELKKKGIKSMLTLHHFINPLWFSQKGGWEKKKNLIYFERFVETCVKNFGDLVDFWATLNEPGVYASHAYFLGIWTPQKKSFGKMVKVFRNLAKGHVIAYRKIHAISKDAIVLPVLSVNSFLTKNIFHKVLADIFYYFVNHWFLKLVGRNYDMIGVNYYGPFEMGPVRFSAGINVMSSIGWKIYPKGISNVLLDFSKRYKVPLFVTENGNADSDDNKRQKYITDHLYWVRHAIKEGADVRGYFYWSLMDNYEWHMGRSVHFGLLETDYKTLKRLPRKSAYLYGEISKKNSIPFTIIPDEEKTGSS